MKARIEKKLSKRLVELAPSIFGDAWIDSDEPTALAYEQGSCVSNIYSVGGGVDYWGEGTDWYTVWEMWQMNWEWHGPFDSYPDGHRFAGMPNTRGFKPTTIDLLRLAADAHKEGK